MWKKIINGLRSALRKKIDPVYKQVSLGFFKERIKLYGVRHADEQKIANAFFKKIKPWPLAKKLRLIEKLLQSNYNEEFAIGADWLFRLRAELDIKHFKIFERWLFLYVTNWAMCDDFCTHILGYLIYQRPELVPKTFVWLKNKNHFVRRAAAVCHIHAVKKSSPFNILKNKGDYLKTVTAAAQALMPDAHYLVQKGYGWLLKEASNVFPKEIYNFVQANKNKMSRTALRYAVEKMPASWKKKAMHSSSAIKILT